MSSALSVSILRGVEQPQQEVLPPLTPREIEQLQHEVTCNK